MTDSPASSPVSLRTGGGSAAVLPPPPAIRRKNRRGGWRAGLEITALSAPGLFVFVTFVIVPVFLAAYYGFFKWKGYGPPTNWVGLHNYAVILQDHEFLSALGHNAQILVLSLVLQGPVAVLFALLLNKKMRGQSVIRVLIFAPYVISEAVSGIGMSLLLNDRGAFNALMDHLGLHVLHQSWLANPSIAMWTLMAILTWKYIGYAVILFLAGLQGIPEELTEAAAIDGASYWKTQWHIILPLLGPTIRIWAFLSIIGSLQLFDVVYIIWGQYTSGVAGVSTMATYMNANGRISGNFGYGSAVAVLMFLISLVIALAYQRFILRRDTAGALTEGES
jgi:ABC-type sugar transport system permease subunit